MCIHGLYFVKTYIVNFHVITALYIALKEPGSFTVDVCSDGEVYLIHHTSYRALNVGFEARDYVFTRCSQLPLLGCRLVSETGSIVQSDPREPDIF